MFHQAVYHVIFKVLYSLRIFYAVFCSVLLWSCSCSAGVYGIWSFYDWSCSMLEMAFEEPGDFDCIYVIFHYKGKREVP